MGELTTMEAAPGSYVLADPTPTPGTPRYCEAPRHGPHPAPPGRHGVFRHHRDGPQPWTCEYCGRAVVDAPDHRGFQVVPCTIVEEEDLW